MADRVARSAVSTTATDSRAMVTVERTARGYPRAPARRIVARGNRPTTGSYRPTQSERTPRSTTVSR